MSRIVIIEDEEPLRDTLKDIFELSGYEVSTAANGRDGFDLILSAKPDLVICDVNMPGLTGFELLGAINQRLENEVIPTFLFLTGMSEKENIRYGMNLGADDYILKPFMPTEVLEIVRLRLEKRKKLIKQMIEPSQTSPAKTVSNKIALPCEDGLELISFDDILKCKADRAYCVFHLIDGSKRIVSKPLKEFESTLSANNFFKMHKSTIINIKYSKNYVRGRGGHLILQDDSVEPIAPSRKDEFLNVLTSSGLKKKEDFMAS